LSALIDRPIVEPLEGEKMETRFRQEQVQTEVERQMLRAWHEAHGIDKGHVHVSWGDDHIVVIIEDAFSTAEQYMALSEEGNAVLDQYVQALLAQVAEEQKTKISHLLQRDIIHTSVSAKTAEQWVMIIFRLAE
jgi:uncharacterized protein YbcI